MKNHLDPVKVAKVAPTFPVVPEYQEAVDLEGVALFMHGFDEGMAGAPLRSSRFTIEPGCGTEADTHAAREIWFISAGTIDVYYDHTRHRVSAGQAVFFEPWRPHFARNTGDVAAQIFSVWWV